MRLEDPSSLDSLESLLFGHVLEICRLVFLGPVGVDRFILAFGSLKSAHFSECLPSITRCG